jgi:hypothetical protein
VVSGEVGIALVLLVGSGLLVRTVFNLVTFDPGFRSDHLLAVGVSSALDPDHPSDIGEHADALRARLQALPGVRSATWSSYALLGQGLQVGIVFLGEGPDMRGEMVDWLNVGPAFFETVEMPLLAGRQVQETDMRPGAPGLWVNRAFAERFLTGQEPIGALVRLGGSQITHEVAGVVANARYSSIRVDIKPTVYVPSRPEANYFLLRTAIDPLALGPTSAGP